MDLTQIGSANEDHKKQGLVEWAMAFKADSWEEVGKINNHSIKEAVKTMQLIVSNPSEKEKIRMREDARRDEITTFGEGVDRKCRELEDIGLPAPIFNNSTFIFKTTVMSASFQEQLMEDASIQRKNALIEN